MAGPELFWPPGIDSTSPPHWPQLKTFTLTFTAATPSGQWLFENDPRCGEYTLDLEDPILRHEDVTLPAPQDYWPDEFRTKPAESINDLYLAAGRAAQHMPKLEVVLLESEPQIGSKVFREMFRDGPSHWFRYARSKSSATWAGTGKFHPSQDVLDAWKSASTAHGNPRLEIMVSTAT